MDHDIKLVLNDQPNALFQIALVGEKVTVYAPENKTPGYEWLQQDFETDEILRITENSHIAPDPSLLGSAGTKKVVLECVGKGNQRLRMANVRKGEWDGFESVGQDNIDSKGNAVHTVTVLCLEESIDVITEMKFSDEL